MLTLNTEMENLKNIIGSASSSCGKSFDFSSLRPVSREDNDTAVADATQAFYLKCEEEQGEFVIIIANPSFPNAVEEAANKARSVASHLNPETGHHILTPLIAGSHLEQSYAVFPRLTAISANKFLRYVQKRNVSNKVCAWLGEVGLQTRQHCDTDDGKEEKFSVPIEFLIDETGMSGDIRKFSRTCRNAISDGSVDLFTVAEHGDFWIGNILYGRSRIPGLVPLLGDFFVIDWRGARMTGYAGIDIVRYCISAFGAESAASTRHIRKYMSTMGISGFQLALYCMSSIGHLGMNLDQFPKERYLELSDSVFGFLKSQKIIN